MGNSDNDDAEQETIRGKHGEHFFFKVRPFVVVRENHNFCLCLPLTTYGGKGTLKRGINVNDYAAVYDSRQEPFMDMKETLSKTPFPIHIEDQKEKIDRMTRLNFGRVYTVEHRVKALKVGMIPREYHPLLRKYFISAIAGDEPTPNINANTLSQFTPLNNNSSFASVGTAYGGFPTNTNVAGLQTDPIQRPFSAAARPYSPVGQYQSTSPASQRSRYDPRSFQSTRQTHPRSYEVSGWGEQSTVSRGNTSEPAGTKPTDDTEDTYDESLYDED